MFHFTGTYARVDGVQPTVDEFGAPALLHTNSGRVIRAELGSPEFFIEYGYAEIEARAKAARSEEREHVGS